MGMRLTLRTTSVFISTVAQVIGSVHYGLRHARLPADGPADCSLHRGLTHPHPVHFAPIGFPHHYLSFTDHLQLQIPFAYYPHADPEPRFPSGGASHPSRDSLS